MKKFVTMLVLVGVVMVGVRAEAQNLIPSLGNSNLQVQVSGYTHIYSLPDSTTAPRPDKVGIPDDDSDLQWGLCRLKVDIKSKTPWGALVEVEAVDLDNADKNWLRQAVVSYKVNSDWSLYAGRIFLAQGWVLSSFADLETVRLSRVPTNCYGYGVQAKGNLGGGLSLRVDVTGKSGVSFDSEENWDALESSMRIQKDFTANLFLAGTVQVSDDVSRYVLDTKYVIGKACFKGAGYVMHETEKEGNTEGFYLYSGYEIWKGVELHAQYDCRAEKDDIWTVGTRLWAPKDQVSLTVDYEYVPGQSDDSRVIARVEFRF